MSKQFLTTVKKANREMSVILYSSNSIPRMTSFGPKPLLKINETPIFDLQCYNLCYAYGNPDIVLPVHFEKDEVISKIYPNARLVESNGCECFDIWSALNIVRDTDILFVDQATVFHHSVLNQKYHTSFVLYSDGNDDDCSLNLNKGKVQSISFNKNNNKWKNILFLKKKNVIRLRRLLRKYEYGSKYFFELINDGLDMDLQLNAYKVPNDKIMTVHNSRDIKDLHEDTYIK